MPNFLQENFSPGIENNFIIIYLFIYIFFLRSKATGIKIASACQTSNFQEKMVN